MKIKQPINYNYNTNKNACKGLQLCSACAFRFNCEDYKDDSTKKR